MSHEQHGADGRFDNRKQLLEENRRLAQRCLELEKDARRQLEKLRAANAALTRGEPDLRLLLENAAIGFALIDLNLRIASANKTLANILGQDQSELPGVNFGNFIYVGKLPAFSRLTSRYTGRGKPNDVIELVARDGALVSCRMAVSEWLDESGALQGHFLLIFDAGPELMAAGRLRDMEQGMAEAEKSRNLFMEVISRELRTPAGGITGMARMLMDSGLNERQNELAGVIHSSAMSLAALVDDLMDVVSSNSGETRPEPEPVSPASLVRGVVNMFGIRAEEKGLELRVHVAQNVPERVMADPHLLRRVLAHLVDNSLKFTDRGHVALSVDIFGDRIRFMVSDTGPGLAPEAEEYMLGADDLQDTPASRRHGGIGIGLAICRRLVAVMGGRISYESVRGRGSEFHFAIPLHIADESLLREPAAPPPVEALHLPPLSILVADANPLSSSLIRAYLDFDGHRLTITDNGIDAAEKCRDSTFDLVILDLNLPKLDGMQTLRLIRESERAGYAKRLPALILASPGQMREEQHYLAYGADGVVKKPVQLVELMTLIAKATQVKPVSVTRQSARTQYGARSGGSSLRRIDGAQLVNLRQIMREEQFTGLLRFFMEDAVPGIIDLKTMAEHPEPDAARITFAASKIRGLAGYLGFSALADLLQRIEDACCCGLDSDELRKQAGELTMVTDDSLEELKRIVPESFATMSDIMNAHEGTAEGKGGEE